MAISNLQTSITNIKSRLYNIQGKLNELVAGVSTDEYADFEIPSNYTLLEYIQANGNCWCNSGYIPKSDTTIYGKFYMASQSSSYPTIFGARKGSPFTLSWYSHNMTDGWAWIRNNVSSTRTGQTKFQNTLVYLDSTENYKTMKFLNEFKEEVGSLTWSSLPTDSRIQHSLYLFALNNDGSVDGATYCSGYRIHYIKFYENGGLVRGYCACLDGNGTPCFYDTVTQTTYYNQGSGSFIAGPEHVRPAPTLPYRELEYIESSGTQYITLISGNVDSTYGLRLKYSAIAEQDNYIAGSKNLSNTRWLMITPALYSNTWCYGWGGTNTSSTSPRYNISSYPSGLNNVYEAELNYLNSKTIKFANNSATTISSSSASFTNTDFYLFKSYSNAMTGRIYYAKLSIGSDVVMDLIPVQRKLDNVICLYDKVSKTYLENAGTGTFIAGPEKTNKPYKQLDYIESTGTQYIETNYTPNNNTKVQITVSDVKVISSVPNAVLFSASNTWDYNIFALTYQNQHGVNGYRYMLPGDVVFGTGTYSNKNIIEVFRGSVWFNNSSVRTDTATKTFGHVATLHFCGENRYNDSGYQHNNYKTHSFKIWENDILRFDFIPVKRKSDDVVCMYDLVSGQFYTNSGTGTFIAGPEV